MSDAVLDYLRSGLAASVAIKQRMLDDPELLQVLSRMGEGLIECYRRGGRLLVAGNGGSAADAQHIAAEFVGSFGLDRPALPAQALTSNASVLSAVANDYGYEHVFARQVEAFAAPGDVFLALSTSGTSANVLNALRVCRERGLRTFGLTGASGGQMQDLCDHCLRVPGTETPRLQEAHLVIGHILCGLVERALFTDSGY